MATITVNGEVRELELRDSNGTDFLSDIIGQDPDVTVGETADWVMTEQQFSWWERWARREQRINDRIEELGEHAVEMACKLADLYGFDYELLQDVQEKAFGIEEE